MSTQEELTPAALHQLLEDHMSRLHQDYTFPLSTQDAQALYGFFVESLHSNPVSGHLLARILVAATVHLSADPNMAGLGRN